jgi:hypothetical protein
MSGNHSPPDEATVPEHCVWKPFASQKLLRHGCLGTRARSACFCDRNDGCLEIPFKCPLPFKFSPSIRLNNQARSFPGTRFDPSGPRVSRRGEREGQPAVQPI